MITRFQLSGWVADIPELTTTKTGLDICTIQIRSKLDDTPIPVKFFKEHAAEAGKFEEGALVFISGAIRARTRKANNGGEWKDIELAGYEIQSLK